LGHDNKKKIMVQKIIIVLLLVCMHMKLIFASDDSSEDIAYPLNIMRSPSGSDEDITSPADQVHVTETNAEVANFLSSIESTPANNMVSSNDQYTAVEENENESEEVEVYEHSHDQAHQNRKKREDEKVQVVIKTENTNENVAVVATKYSYSINNDAEYNDSINKYKDTSAPKKPQNYNAGKYRAMKKTWSSIGMDRYSGRKDSISPGTVVTVESVREFRDRIRGRLTDKSWISIEKLDGFESIIFAPVQKKVTWEDEKDDSENDFLNYQRPKNQDLNKYKRKLIHVENHESKQNSKVFAVETILSERTVNDQQDNLLHEYLVKWEGYKEPSWEPVDQLKGNTAAINFRERKRLATLLRIISMKGLYKNGESVPVFKLEWQDMEGERFYTRELFDNYKTLTRKQLKKFDYLIQEYIGIYKKKLKL